MPDISDKIIVALDVGTLKEAKHFVELLYPKVRMFKVGSQLFTACGHEAVKTIGQRGARVFLDLKFYDIPNTVFAGVASGTGIGIDSGSFNIDDERIVTRIKNNVCYPVFMMTVHAQGGMEMLRSAAKGAFEKAKELGVGKPFIVGVTRLTSDEPDENTLDEVLRLAHRVKDAGLDGVVCSAAETRQVRQEFGKDFIIVTPGIRSKSSNEDDQKRTATADEAFSAGSDFLVVGRPILRSRDPLKALEDLLK